MVAALFGCAQGGKPSPSIDQLAAINQPVFIDKITVSFSQEPSTDTLFAKLQTALAELRSAPNPTGRAATLNVHINNFHDMGVGQTLLVGGSNQLGYSLRLLDSQSNAPLYQVDRQIRSGWAPGGIVSAIIEASRDDELRMSKALVRRMQKRVLQKNSILVARGARIEKVGIQPTAVNPVLVVGTGNAAPTGKAPAGRLAMLEAAAKPSVQTKREAFQRLSDGPLRESEIKALFSGINVTTADSNEEIHNFDRTGTVFGQTTTERPDNGFLNEDEGRWSVNSTGRFCAKWFDWYTGKNNCYRVSKRGDNILLQGRSGRIVYTIVN